jgi:hypothetical protein
MKRYKLLPVCIIITLLLPSCIDANDSNISIVSDKDFVYITSLNNVLCATTSCGYVTCPQIKELKLNECYFISYQLDGKKENNIYLANEFANISEGPIPQGAFSIDKVPTQASWPVKDLKISQFVPTKYKGDRWLLSYSFSSNSKKEIIPSFYYDSSKQIDKDGRNIMKDNKIVIDVHFKESNLNIKTNERINGQYSVVADLERLREIYSADYDRASTGDDGKKQIPVLIQFRFYKDLTDGKTEVSYAGTWDAGLNNKAYYMVFIQKS